VKFKKYFKNRKKLNIEKNYYFKTKIQFILVFKLMNSDLLNFSKIKKYFEQPICQQIITLSSHIINFRHLLITNKNKFYNKQKTNFTEI